jgi:nitrate reductase alpha subunit
LVPVVVAQADAMVSRSQQTGACFGFAGFEICDRRSAEYSLIRLCLLYPDYADAVRNRVNELRAVDDSNIVDVAVTVCSEFTAALGEIQEERKKRAEMIQNPKMRNLVVPRNAEEARYIERLNDIDALEEKIAIIEAETTACEDGFSATVVDVVEAKVGITRVRTEQLRADAEDAEARARKAKAERVPSIGATKAKAIADAKARAAQAKKAKEENDRMEASLSGPKDKECDIA